MKLSYKNRIIYLDKEDLDIFNSHNWRVKLDKNVYYLVSYSTGQRFHRLVWEKHNKNLPKIIDHKNGNGLDNQKKNLRDADESKNGGNRPRNKNKTSSKYKGVYLDPKSNKWRARIVFNKTHISIGSFKKEKEAAVEYDKKALELFGEYARLNFRLTNYLLG